MKSLRLLTLVALAVCLLTASASADPISLPQGGSVTLNYVGNNPGYSGTVTLALSGNQLTITITNTSSGIGAFIGAFGMSTTPNTTPVNATFSGGVSGYTICGGGNCGLGGTVEVAFGGSGNPSGLQQGQSGTIVFNFTSSPSNPNPLVIDFDVLHFQGLGLSEKLTHTDTPEPASLFLLGSGLLGAGSLVRKRFGTR